MIERLATDILIIGAGGAGLFAALHAKQAAPELEVTVAVKGLLGKCGCTRMVQGGYNVALAPEDSLERHFMDTIAGGGWLPRQDLAWKLVTSATARWSSSRRTWRAHTCSARRPTISMPVRSPLCTVRSKLCPAKAFCKMCPWASRSKKAA